METEDNDNIVDIIAKLIKSNNLNVKKIEELEKRIKALEDVSTTALVAAETRSKLAVAP